MSGPNESCTHTSTRFLAQNIYGYSRFALSFGGPALHLLLRCLRAALLTLSLLLLEKSQRRASCLLPHPSLSHPVSLFPSARVKEFARARCSCSFVSWSPLGTHRRMRSAGLIRFLGCSYPSVSWSNICTADALEKERGTGTAILV